MHGVGFDDIYFGGGASGLWHPCNVISEHEPLFDLIPNTIPFDAIPTYLQKSLQRGHELNIQKRS